jgi:uncharacterized protein YjbI with pentapeptide repeats
LGGEGFTGRRSVLARLVDRANFFEGLPARQPATAIGQHLGVDPKSHIGVTGRNQFSEYPLILILAVDDLKMSPAEGVFPCCPFGAEQMGKFLLLGHRDYLPVPYVYLSDVYLNGSPWNPTFMLKSTLKHSLAVCLLSLGLVLPARAENPAHIQQLLATKKCAGCDLTGAGLVLAKLPGADLVNANLVGANLSQANLAGANLKSANLAGVNLAGANLQGANLQGVNLSGVDLRGTYLVGADLTGVQYGNADIRSAVGLPDTVGTAAEFYRWAMEAGQQKRFEAAIDYFDKALVRQPNFPDALIGRGMALNQIGDQTGAIANLQQAIELYKKQGDKVNADSIQKVVKVMQTPEKEPQGGSGAGQAVMGVAGLLLKVFFGI